MKTTICSKHILPIEMDAAQTESLSREVDVVIIGSGYAGLAAAIEAANALPNGSVLIIEKNSCPGGNSIMNAG